jgi:hypothetical protein
MNFGSARPSLPTTEVPGLLGCAANVAGCYTLGMKTAISLPDNLFADGERLAAQLRISRSELYGRALKEFLTTHSADPVTTALDALCDELDTGADAFAVRSARRTLARSEW